MKSGCHALKGTNMDEYPTSWESVSTDSGMTTIRLRVPGGWIVAITDSGGGVNVIGVNDPQGTWILTT